MALQPSSAVGGAKWAKAGHSGREGTGRRLRPRRHGILHPAVTVVAAECAAPGSHARGCNPRMCPRKPGQPGLAGLVRGGRRAGGGPRRTAQSHTATPPRPGHSRAVLAAQFRIPTLPLRRIRLGLWPNYRAAEFSSKSIFYSFQKSFFFSSRRF